MFGLFQLFGRSRNLKALDDALRNAGLEPRAVPEAVKLTAIRLLNEGRQGNAPLSDTRLDEAAGLIGYCMLGHDQFIASHGIGAATQIAERVEEAIAAGDSLDAKLILLTQHAGVLVAEIAEQFEIETL